MRAEDLSRRITQWAPLEVLVLLAGLAWSQVIALTIYGPPTGAPAGLAVEVAGHCVGYTWANGAKGQNGWWVGCDR